MGIKLHLRTPQSKLTLLRQPCKSQLKKRKKLKKRRIQFQNIIGHHNLGPLIGNHLSMTALAHVRASTKSARDLLNNKHKKRTFIVSRITDLMRIARRYPGQYMTMREHHGPRVPHNQYRMFKFFPQLVIYMNGNPLIKVQIYFSTIPNSIGRTNRVVFSFRSNYRFWKETMHGFTINKSRRTHTNVGNTEGLQFCEICSENRDPEYHKPSKLQMALLDLTLRQTYTVQKQVHKLKLSSRNATDMELVHRLQSLYDPRLPRLQYRTLSNMYLDPDGTLDFMNYR